MLKSFAASYAFLFVSAPTAESEPCNRRARANCSAHASARKLTSVLQSELPKPYPETAWLIPWKAKLLANSASGENTMKAFRRCNVSGIKYHWAHLNAFMVAPTLGALNVHVYKNGGTAVQEAFTRNGGYVYNIYGKAHTEKFLEAMIYNPGWFRTAFIRDPIPRALSSFHEVSMRIAAADKNSSCERSKQASFDILGRMLAHMERGELSKIPFGYHFLPQIHFMMTAEGSKLPLDYLGQASDIVKEMKFILQKPDLKLNYRSGPTKAVCSDSFRLREEDVPVKIRVQICRIYKRDYCCYGFKFPAACTGFVCT